MNFYTFLGGKVKFDLCKHTNNLVIFSWAAGDERSCFLSDAVADLEGFKGFA